MAVYDVDGNLLAEKNPEVSLGYIRSYSDITSSLTFERKRITTEGITDSTTYLLAELPNSGKIEIKFSSAMGVFAVFKKATGGTITMLRDYNYWTYVFTPDRVSQYYVCLKYRSDYGTTTILPPIGGAITRIFLYEDIGYNYSGNIPATLKGKTLATIGDSIVQGIYKDLSANDNRCALKPWTNLVSETIGCAVANYGVGGGLVYNSDTRSMYQTCEDVVGYDVVILCGGTNDYGGNTSEANFRTAFQHVLDTLVANNTNVIVATPTTRTNRTAQNSAGLYLSDYCTIEKNLAQAMNLQVIDLNVLTNTDEFKATLNDGLHPNEMGHRIIADLILANA